MNGRPKVYMGRDGFKGMSSIGKPSYLEKMAGPQKKPSVYIGNGGVSVRNVLANGGIVRGGMVRVKTVALAKPVYMGGKGGAEAARGEVKPKETVLKVIKPRFPIIPPKPEKRLEKFSKAMAEKEMEFIEVDAKTEKPGEAEVRKNMIEMAREPNLAATEEQPKQEIEKATISPKEGIKEGVGACLPPKDEQGNCAESQVGMTETEERLTDFLAAAQEVVSPLEDGKADPSAETRESIAAREEMRTAILGLPLGEVPLESGKKRRGRTGRRVKAKNTEVSEAERAAIQAELEAASDAAANVE